jgi:DNA replication protein DnaC
MAELLGITVDEARERAERAHAAQEGLSWERIYQREVGEQRREAMRSRLDATIPFKHRDVPPETLLRGLHEWDCKRWLYFTGPTGTGKTTQLAALARMFFDRFGGDVVWYHAQELFDRMRDSFDDRKLYPRDAHTARLLIIDDLGDENPTRFVASKMSKIVNDRYEGEGLVLVVSSNFSPAELAARLVTTEGDGHHGKRIASRLGEMTTLVRLGGADRRLGGTR